MKNKILAVKLETVNSKLANYSLLLQQLKRQRDEHTSSIRFLLLEQFHISMALQSSRTIWKHPRESCFWEVDVPNMTDEKFKETFRMHRNSFGRLCDLMAPMAKEDNNFQKSISLPKRVAIGLFTLKSSAEYLTISQLFGVGKSTVCAITIAFCNAIWQQMSDKYLPSNFLSIEKINESIYGFEDLGFPQCFGAIDGCHIEVRPPVDEAYDHYNYKGWLSTVLLAVVDYRYRFLYINVGCPGRCNDASIFEKSTLYKKLSDGILKDNIRCINGQTISVFLIGDSAFRLSEFLMKPYPFSIAASEREKLYNYNLSKCRRVVENAFGHIKARFRRIGKGIDNNISNANKIIKACCVLHNFLNTENDKINVRWLQVQKRFEREHNRRQPAEIYLHDFNPHAQSIRNCLADYMSKQNLKS